MDSISLSYGATITATTATILANTMVMDTAIIKAGDLNITTFRFIEILGGSFVSVSTLSINSPAITLSPFSNITADASGFACPAIR